VLALAIAALAVSMWRATVPVEPVAWAAPKSLGYSG
jgi:hypothetical protein